MLVVYMRRIVDLLVVVLALWFAGYMLGAVDAPNWRRAGELARDMAALFATAWQGFSEGFYQR